jgi:TonB-dependent SusC/RagA subfamily outer membrane receptor
MTKQIFLTKKIETAKPGDKKVILLGRISADHNNNTPLYVIDNIPCKAGVIPDLNPDHIASISVLKTPEATLIYGAAAVAGVIIITTKNKEDTVYKNLDCIVVTGFGTEKRTSVMGMMSTGVTIKRTATDTLKLITTKITGSIKIYPNPVQKGNAAIVSFTVKQPGKYFIQVTNTPGQLLMQQQFFTAAKENTQPLQTDSRWGSGVYYIRLLDDKNNLLSTNSFIVQ